MSNIIHPKGYNIILIIYIMVDRKESNKVFKRFNLDKKKVTMAHFNEAINMEDPNMPCEERSILVIKNMVKMPDHYKRLKKMRKTGGAYWQNKDKNIFTDLTGGTFWDAIKNPVATVKEAFRDVPSKLSYQAQDTLKKLGNLPVLAMKIVRVPLNGALTGTLNAVSLGKWNELVKKEGYDKLYHLSLLVALQGGKQVVLEKNEVVAIYESKGFSSKAEYLPITTPQGLTLTSMVDKTIKYMGENNFYSYNALSNNCQVFIMSILKANGANTTEAEKFVYQNFDNVKKGLDTSGFSYVPKIMNKVTNLGSIVSRLTGRGTKEKALEEFEVYLKRKGLDLEDRDATDEFIKFVNSDGLKFL